jgi:hypothetical protein
MSENSAAARLIHSPVGPILWSPLLGGAGVYAIWHNDGRFIYVGMSGRGITAMTTRRNTPQGIYTRLQSHASGRRSGDQFCVYVADRLVLPTLAQEDIAAISSGRHQMDAFVRQYIHENLCYRFLMLPDGAAAYRLEAAIRDGGWEYSRNHASPIRARGPFLAPDGRATYMEALTPRRKKPDPVTSNYSKTGWSDPMPSHHWCRKRDSNNGAKYSNKRKSIPCGPAPAQLPVQFATTVQLDSAVLSSSAANGRGTHES